MSRKRQYQTVVRSILDMLESRDYPPGARLPGERQLSEKFGVSRAVVRGAEIFLEALGHLELREGSGAYVRSFEKVEGLSRLGVTPFELTQIRRHFETECSALAASAISDLQLSTLRQLIDGIAQAPLDAIQRDDADRAFHIEIARATDNAANVYVLQSLWRMRTEIESVRRVCDAVCIEDTAHRVREYSAILDSLSARDSDAARQAMGRHFDRLIEALLDASERQAIEAARLRSHANRERYLRFTVAN